MLWLVTCSFFVLVGTVEIDTDEKWKQYKSEYNKTFTSQEEEESRHLIWEGNLEYIRQHNLEADNGLHSYRLGVNAFADLSPDEFVQQRTSQSKTNKISSRSSARSVRISARLPTEIDWRAQGFVTSVKDQGECSSGYAFSAVGCVEGQYFMDTGRLVSLSAQNILDCSKNFGCNGGFITDAFGYILENGIESEEDYPYVGMQGRCEFDVFKVETNINAYVKIQPEDEYQLQEAVVNIGPVSAEIRVDYLSFRFYESGVYDDPGCSSKCYHHAVLVVGYGESGGKQYWIVKNSWGEGWGEAGYILMSRNKNNQCGIASNAYYANVY